ncbi:MAG: ATP-binding protein [Spirochaetales bacterium]|nr:ATP-binding protein [Spirochaetales bacterium]
MLSDKKGRDRHKSIKHKTRTVFIVVIILTVLFSMALFLLQKKLPAPLRVPVILAALALYTTLISGYAARALSYKFALQVNRMTDTARAISNSKNLEKRITPSPRDDELKTLEESLNAMLDQIEQFFEKQRRFVSDASHELRTPLSIINGYLDIISGWGLTDEKIAKESIQAMKEETLHMKNLTEHLLAIARSDKESGNPELTPVSLNAVVSKLESMRFLCGGRRLTIKVEEDTVINGDSLTLIQTLRAIVENSIKYTDETGSIIITAYREENKARIDITDDGIGIPENEIDKIFERFYRGEDARSVNTSGSGLGLSLVKEIMDLHNGRIKIENRQVQGTTVSLFFPLISSPI